MTVAVKMVLPTHPRLSRRPGALGRAWRWEGSHGANEATQERRAGAAWRVGVQSKAAAPMGTYTYPIRPRLTAPLRESQSQWPALDSQTTMPCRRCRWSRLSVREGAKQSIFRAALAQPTCQPVDQSVQEQSVQEQSVQEQSVQERPCKNCEGLGRGASAHPSSSIPGPACLQCAVARSGKGSAASRGYPTCIPSHATLEGSK